MRTACLAMLLAALLAGHASAQDKKQPMPPDEQTLTLLTQKHAELAAKLTALDKDAPDPTRTDIEVCERAVRMMLTHNEFPLANSVKWAQTTLALGAKRVEPKGAGMLPAGKVSVLGYRSQVDGSVQPYALVLPHDFGKDDKKAYRLDVVLHGRDATLTEVQFVASHNGKDVPKDRDFIQLDVYGRGNNAYRWAGEADVFEAMDDVFKRYRQFIDIRRLVLRGFSMGGAGAWHIGLRRPEHWAVIGPGAGFTTTRGYLKGLPEKLPDYLEKCLHIYDAVDYSENIANVPVVAYAGEKDGQIQAGRNIEKRLKSLGLSMDFLIAPDTEHKLTPEYAKKAEVLYQKYAGQGHGRELSPAKVRFVTYTLASPECNWLKLMGLHEHYQQTRVEASRGQGAITLVTKNVQALRLIGPFQEQRVTLDGQDLPLVAGEEVKGGPAVADFEYRAGKWHSRIDKKTLRKRPGLQGPIDDAFTRGFLVIAPTGDGLHPETSKYVAASLKQFSGEWSKYMRGDVPTKSADRLTDLDMRDKHIVVFGDPKSNPIIARLLPNLPLQWSAERLKFGGQEHDPAKHVPVMIYPNPLAPGKYIVINSGHTFHADAFTGTNALLYPRLGDFAILRPDGKGPTSAEVVRAGLFNEGWQLPE